VTIKDEKAVAIHEKNTVNNGFVYIGLCGIHEYEKFWDYMKRGVNYGSIDLGESYGLSKFIATENNLLPIQFTWFDTGTIANLSETRKHYFNNQAPEILDKPNEAIWFVNNAVIKYFNDENMVSQRVSRANKMPNYVPFVTKESANLYSYNMIKGKTLSKVVNRSLFCDFMNFMEVFWEPHELSLADKDQFKKSCMKFYRDKTHNRINKFFNRFEITDEEEIINGITIPKISTLLSKVDWDYISDGFATRYHGDMHFENILVTESGDFVMLDWRQNFAGIIDYGDIYYDFAKLLHGLIVNHELVNKEHFDFYRDGGVINFDILRKNKLVECEKMFAKKINQMGFDYKKVEIMTALIFLNIAALHHEPYGEFLFYLGKYMLYGELNE